MRSQPNSKRAWRTTPRRSRSARKIRVCSTRLRSNCDGGRLPPQVEELSAQENEAREARRRAAELRDRATSLEAEASGVRLPSAQQLASIESLQSAIENRKSAGPGAPARSTALPLLGGLVAATVGFAVGMVCRLREHGALYRRRARTRSRSGSDHRPQR